MEFVNTRPLTFDENHRSKADNRACKAYRQSYQQARDHLRRAERDLAETAAFMAGSLTTSSSLPFNVPPGGTIDISLNMTAPSVPGSYASSWMFRNASSTLFGIGDQANLPWLVSLRVPDPTLTPDSPTSFQDHYVCQGTNNNTNLYLGFGVTLSNTQDVGSVTAYSGPSIVVPMQDTGGGVYAGTVDGSGGYSPGMVVPYYFVVQDKVGQNIRSDDYSSTLIACGPVVR